MSNVVLRGLERIAQRASNKSKGRNGHRHTEFNNIERASIFICVRVQVYFYDAVMQKDENSRCTVLNVTHLLSVCVCSSLAHTHNKFQNRRATDIMQASTHAITTYTHFSTHTHTHVIRALW